jgi:hypothetical protein
VRRLHPRNERAAVADLHELGWDLVTIRSSRRCPQCEEGYLQPLLDPESGEIILSCDLCSWSETMDGQEWNGPSQLVPAPTSKLSHFLNLSPDHH